MVNEQCYNLSLSTKGCSKSNVNLSGNTKNLSTSLLPSIQQRSSIVEKFDKTQFNNSAVKAARALNSNKRSQFDFGFTTFDTSILSTFETNGGFGVIQI